MNNKSVTRNILGSTLLMAFTLFSCDTNRIYEAYQGMEKLSWPISDTVAFDITAPTDEEVLSTLRIKYNEKYDYYNLYVRYLLRDSLGQVIENELLDMNLFDPKTGKPLGSGYGNRFTQVDTLPLKKILTDQTYQIQLIQYMRSNDLDGIESVGVKLERLKD